MQYRAHTFAPLFVTFLLGGCDGGGGGDGGGGQPSAGSFVNTAEGIWTVQGSNGDGGLAVILEDGRTWGATFNTAQTDASVLFGQTIGSGGRVTGSLNEYTFNPPQILGGTVD